MMVRGDDCYAFAPASGLFEPKNVVGEEVEEGGLAGFLHFVEDVDHAPLEIRYRRSGVLWMASGPGRLNRGDVAAVVMNDYDAGLAT